MLFQGPPLNPKPPLIQHPASYPQTQINQLADVFGSEGRFGLRIPSAVALLPSSDVCVDTQVLLSVADRH